jgi:Ca-activated chloride channel family protein
MPSTLPLSPQILLTPERPGLTAGRDNVLDLLVRVQLPEAPPGTLASRPPQALALVIDRSGSMAGPPLYEACRCAEFVVDRLRPQDPLALVQFDQRVDVLLPARPRGDGEAARQAIRTIHDGGSTNLHGGWQAGAAALREVTGPGLKRVILLSDGQANVGCTDDDLIAQAVAEVSGAGITTSTYGLGRHFNENLMIQMAKAGAGNHYYGDTAEDLAEPFEEELSLLANLGWRDVRLTLTPAPGIEAEMLNELAPQGQAWRLPDIAWGAEAWAVIRLRIPAGLIPSATTSPPLLSVQVSGQTPAGETQSAGPVTLTLPGLAAAAAARLPASDLVHQRRGEVEAGNILLQVRQAALRGEWQRVEALVREARERFSDNEWTTGILQAMHQLVEQRQLDRLSKETRYSSARLSRRLAATRVREEGEPDNASYLRRKILQGKSLH